MRRTGGRRGRFSPGAYRCGTVRLRSNITLRILPGATVLGSPRKSDYAPFEELDFENEADVETSYFRCAIFYGEDLERIGLCGGGVIDADFTSRGGPKPIAFKRCRFAAIENLTILNPPNYGISMLGTDDVVIDGVTILNGFADGIDPDSCKNVRIANCRVQTRDDAIVLKASFSLGERRACENITVTNCVLSTVCNGFKLGTESGGGFKRITFSNSVVTGFKDHRPAISGIALESVDGGELDGIALSNIVMHNVRAPVFIRLGNRGRDMDTPVPGTLRNVTINNITATRASLASSITGIPGHCVENVTLSDIFIRLAGGNPLLAESETVPEKAGMYPEALMFGPLPADGLYCRHVRGLVLRNVRFEVAGAFWRLTTDRYPGIEWPETGPPSHSQPAEPGPLVVVEDTTGKGFTADFRQEESPPHRAHTPE